MGDEGQHVMNFLNNQRNVSDWTCDVNSPCVIMKELTDVTIEGEVEFWQGLARYLINLLA